MWVVFPIRLLELLSTLGRLNLCVEPLAISGMYLSVGVVMPEPLSSHSSHELILVADPHAGLRVREGKVISIVDGVDVGPLASLMDSERAIIRPLYGVSEDWLKFRTPNTGILMGVDQPLDLSIFYKITSSDNKLKPLASQLRELSVVQSAYIKPAAALPFIDTGDQVVDGLTHITRTDDFTKYQEYLGSATCGGVDARYAWTKVGGRGRGVKIIDVEGGWCFSHEDLLENPSDCVGGFSVLKSKWRKHGTAVLGILAGDHNGLGISGMCPEADVSAVSIFGNPQGDPSPDWGSAAAIRCAADRLSPGNIILLELHRPGPAVGFQEDDSTQAGYIPIEWWPCDLAAIRYATSRGVIVVAAAGNGQQNLSDGIYDQNPQEPYGPFPPWWSNPFRRKPIDSNAILVGAGFPPHRMHGHRNRPDRSLWDLSNYGNVVDAQGWGAEVTTCGGNNDLSRALDENRRYTRTFNGTSSAAAMVTGVVGCLQGELRTAGVGILDPLWTRQLLRDNNLGSPQQNGYSGPAAQLRIGPRPDLRKLIDHLVP